MTTKLYITKEYLYPLQMKIYEIIVQSNLSTMTESGSTDMVVRQRHVVFRRQQLSLQRYQF